jgi:hypothetical protein
MELVLAWARLALKRASLATPHIQPTTTDIAMGKGWPFCKTKHNGQARSSSANKEKTTHNRQYVPVELTHRLFEENRLVPWSDAGLRSGGWYLNCRRVPVESA